jgi:lysylphosphatidylglycerol synthetase-like protein (DUF2156 family)
MQIAAFLGLVVLIVVVVLALGTAPKKGVEYSAPALAPILLSTNSAGREAFTEAATAALSRIFLALFESVTVCNSRAALADGFRRASGGVRGRVLFDFGI